LYRESLHIAVYFSQALRIDYFHTGDAREEMITIDHIYQEEIWPGNTNNLIDPFNNGRYGVKVCDAASNQLLYSRGFTKPVGKNTDLFY
jgi:hypothetical protein